MSLKLLFPVNFIVVQIHACMPDSKLNSIEYITLQQLYVLLQTDNVKSISKESYYHGSLIKQLVASNEINRGDFSQNSAMP